MSQRTEIALSQNDTQPIARVSNDSLTSENGRSSLALSSNQGNELAQKKILNSVTNSSEVYINNTNNNIYNGSVVITNVYPQNDTTQQSATENTADVPERSFFKRFFSISRWKVQQRYSPKCYLTIPVLLLLMIGLIVGLMIWLWDSENSQTGDSSSLSNTTSDLGDLRIVSRAEWGARSPKAKADLLTTRPAPLNDHMGNCTWNDIGYNFLIGGDGFVYEGRGWDVAGAHTKGYNYWSIGIGLIGTFIKENPTTVQLTATRRLIEYGVKNGYISVDYKLLGDRQCKKNSTDPGDALYSIIQTWDHWSPKCQLS